MWLLGYRHHRGIGSGPGDVSRFFDAHIRAAATRAMRRPGTFRSARVPPLRGVRERRTPPCRRPLRPMVGRFDGSCPESSRTVIRPAERAGEQRAEDRHSILSYAPVNRSLLAAR
jgi:hypothetical protein